MEAKQSWKAIWHLWFSAFVEVLGVKAPWTLDNRKRGRSWLFPLGTVELIVKMLYLSAWLSSVAAWWALQHVLPFPWFRLLTFQANVCCSRWNKGLLFTFPFQNIAVCKIRFSGVGSKEWIWWLRYFNWVSGFDMVLILVGCVHFCPSHFDKTAPKHGLKCFSGSKAVYSLKSFPIVHL